MVTFPIQTNAENMLFSDMPGEEILHLYRCINMDLTAGNLDSFEEKILVCLRYNITEDVLNEWDKVWSAYAYVNVSNTAEVMDKLSKT